MSFVKSLLRRKKSLDTQLDPDAVLIDKNLKEIHHRNKFTFSLRRNKKSPGTNVVPSLFQNGSPNGTASIEHYRQNGSAIQHGSAAKYPSNTAGSANGTAALTTYETVKSLHYDSSNGFTTSKSAKLEPQNRDQNGTALHGSVDRWNSTANETAIADPRGSVNRYWNRTVKTTDHATARESPQMTFERLEQELLSLADDLQPLVARSTPRNTVPAPRTAENSTTTTMSRDRSAEPEENRGQNGSADAFEHMLENSLKTVQLLQNNLNCIVNEVSHKKADH